MRFTHLCNTILLAIAVTHVGAAPTSNALGNPAAPQNGSLDARSWSWGSRSSRPPPDFQIKERDARSASYEHLPSWTQAQSISARQLNERTLVQRNDRPLRRDEDSSDDTDAMRTGSGSSSSYEPVPPHGPEADPPHDRMQSSELDGPLSRRDDGNDGEDVDPADGLDDPSYSADITSDTSGPQSEPEPESCLSRRDDDGEDTAPADELDGDGSSPADASSDASSDTSDAPATNVQATSTPADQSGPDAATTSGTDSTPDSGDTQPAAPGVDADGSSSASSDGAQAASAPDTTSTDSSNSTADSPNSDAGSETAAPDSGSSEGATDADADDNSPSDGTIAGSELLRCRNVGRDALCED